MTRYRAIFDGQGLKAEIENDRLVFLRFDPRYDTQSDLPRPMVVRDIEPYRSMIDGRVITSRSAHREHLRANGCVEVGNEDPSKHVAPAKTIGPSRRESLTRMLADDDDRGMNKLIKKLKKDLRP